MAEITWHSYPKAKVFKICIFIISIFLSFGSVFAEESSAENELTEIEYYKDDNKTNQIPLFDNRFRIDAQLEEVTLLFYHKPGTPPVILVRPDGTKVRIDNVDKEQVQWYDDISFDMIRIKAPMPGPWQVIGSVLPNSKIMVLTDIRIEVDPLPKVLLAGETLKIEATLHNGKKAIDQPAFRNVVNLDVDFVSTNNSKFENFAAGVVELTTFRDDGRDLDEFAGDGIFTGEFELKLPAGEWEPVYSIKLPMVERRLAQAPVILRQSPVEIVVDKTNNELEAHHVTLNIDPQYVKPESLIFQGKITFPDKQVQPFSILTGEGGKDPNKRTIKFGYTEPGVHRLNINVFGETIYGREFRLVLHEFTFNVESELVLAHESQESDEVVEEPKIDPQEELMNKIREQNLAAEQALMALKAEQKAQQEMKAQIQLFIIIAGNLLLLIIAAVGFWLYKRRQK